jgi:NADH:ubiquinone oxidoreductase subunit 4 (subunit M)
MVPMVILIFLMGIYPKLFFSKMDVSVEKFLKDFKGKVEMKANLPAPILKAEIVKGENK